MKDLAIALAIAAAAVTALPAQQEIKTETRVKVDDGKSVVYSGCLANEPGMQGYLLENAVRHTPPGTHVHATVAARDGEVVFGVDDDGPGVPPELRDRVFERFTRGAGDRGSSSSGLGLSIVRAVAESHGGSVELEEGGPGARFVVRLPRAAVRAPEPVA